MFIEEGPVPALLARPQLWRVPQAQRAGPRTAISLRARVTPLDRRGHPAGPAFDIETLDIGAAGAGLRAGPSTTGLRDCNVKVFIDGEPVVDVLAQMVHHSEHRVGLRFITSW